MERLNAILRLLKKYNSESLHIEYNIKNNDIKMKAVTPVSSTRAELKNIKVFNNDIFTIGLLLGLAGISPDIEPITSQFNYILNGIKNNYRLATIKNNNTIYMVLREV